jgi:hypothetical protein
MFPKSPSPQNAEGVESLFVLFLNPLLSFPPPISKGNPPSGCQTCQVERLQDGIPELSCKDTHRENVLGCFILFITQLSSRDKSSKAS